MKINGLEVTFTTQNNLNITVKDSYKVVYSDEIIQVLQKIRNTEEYKKIESLGYTRSISSQRREWEAHNLLYYMHIFKSRTSSVDLDQKESLFRKTGYFFLSLIYRIFVRKV